MGLEIETVEQRLKSFLSQLQSEFDILERIVYKNKNQQRRCYYFQYLMKQIRAVPHLVSSMERGLNKSEGWADFPLGDRLLGDGVAVVGACDVAAGAVVAVVAACVGAVVAGAAACDAAAGAVVSAGVNDLLLHIICYAFGTELNRMCNGLQSLVKGREN
nr:Ribonuclease MRP protein subunit rmp1 like [Ipomoea batatas]